MLTTGTKIKLVAFVLFGLSVILYIGSHYAGLGRYVGMPGYYTVKLRLNDSGGLFPNSEVTYRGVPIGRVGSLSLVPDGIQATLHIDNGRRIPVDVQAVVSDLSAVGEEYVDLRPGTAKPPYLKSGSVIPQTRGQTPPPVTNLLTDLDRLASSVPQQALRTVVSELGQAFTGQGPNLQVLLDTSGSLTESATADIPQTTSLIDDGQTVMATQNDEARALRDFGNGARLLAEQLDASDPDLRRLITSTPQAAVQVSGLLRDLGPNLGVLLANLLTTSDITLTRQDALQELLVKLPEAINAATSTITSKGARFGIAVTFFNPLPCVDGYGGTVYRNGLTTTPGPPVNTSARCTEPPGQGEVRGSANAPFGGGVPPVVPPAQSGLKQLLGLTN